MKKETGIYKTDDKEDKYLLKRDLLIVGIILFFVLLYFVGTQKQAISEFFANTFWSMKPYSVAHFNKLPRPNNNEKICNIAGETTQITNTFFTYTKDTINIYDSLSLTNHIDSIDVPGEIINIHCFYFDNFDMYDYLQNDNDKEKFSNGMFVLCEYKRDKRNHLICLNIGRNNYERYRHVKFYKDKYGPNEDNVRKHYFESMNSIANKFDNNYSTTIINKYTEVYNNWIHPAKTIRKIYDVEIGNSQYLSISNDNNGISAILVDRTSGEVSLLNNNGKVSSRLSFKKIIWCHTIPGEDVYCMLYDGSELYSINVKNSKLEINKSSLINSSSDKDEVVLFIDDEPINFVYSSDYIISINGKLEKIGFVDLTRQKLAFNADPTAYSSIYYTDKSGKTCIFDFQEDTTILTDYKFLHCEGFWLSNQQIYELRYATSKEYISLAIDKNNLCSVLIFFNNHIFSLSTNNIDEPVDEAHVTYEDGKLTIYLMNKNSIYRWQNSQDDISNLKFRKLDLKPEPIKTTPTN